MRVDVPVVALVVLGLVAVVRGVLLGRLQLDDVGDVDHAACRDLVDGVVDGRLEAVLTRTRSAFSISAVSLTDSERSCGSLPGG